MQGDLTTSMHPQGSTEPSLSAPVPPPATADVLGVPLGLSTTTARWTGSTRMVASRPARLRVCLQRAHGDGLGRGSRSALGADGRVGQRPRRPAAGVGAQPPRPRARGPRLRPRADGALVRPRRGPGSGCTCTADATRARWSSSRSTSASAIPACASSGLLPAAPPAHPEEERGGRQGDQRLAGRRRLGRHRRPQAGEVDGPRCATALDAPVLIGVGAAFDFHAGLVPQAPPRMQESGWSGPTALPTSLAACGGATRATTRASWAPSPASCATIAARRRSRAEPGRSKAPPLRLDGP